MIVDCNTHPTENGRWFNTSLNASALELLRQMDASHIDQSVVVPFDGIMSNEFVMALCLQHADRFIPAASFNPAKYRSPDDAYTGFAKQLAPTEARILKLHNRLHRYHLLDKRVFAALEANAQRRRPFVVFICGLIVDKNIRNSLSPPSVFHRLVTHFPDTTFVIMHCAASWALQTYDTIKSCSNVYMDLSYTQSRYKGASLWQDLKFLCGHFDKRLIFGSDFPEICLPDAKADFDELTSGLDSERKDRMLYGNLTNLLKS